MTESIQANEIINKKVISKPSTVIPGSFTGEIQPQNIEEAAIQFEALFMRNLLQQMRKTSDALAEGDNLFNSKQQGVMRDFYDDKLASTLAAQRSSGIADLLIKQLSAQ
ncbi:rod-binding protein [Candidatus Fukatsuia symbiotica]|uniref:Flagellar rod assembly protein/muramidase FlgJ n=1 Tax=Candidatus Fukatsuia symbiotica TaxID=1878942 RepID=A0A2U8I623_9GAMM|nr:rod-binding protein [Candidatus Fukatsuia symbiotica]AWK14623.1 flagellar rod assembly protein/muramidase FlgJ [Candidatus Fukatsuia symbiotica]MEA9444935.1 rod-binding protein [Candidatus Fukatsuia symbiotica]